eukprot:755997-Hanusia_phi.AAC.2
MNRWDRKAHRGDTPGCSFQSVSNLTDPESLFPALTPAPGRPGGASRAGRRPVPVTEPRRGRDSTWHSENSA